MHPGNDPPQLHPGVREGPRIQMFLWCGFVVAKRKGELKLYRGRDVHEKRPKRDTT
jgi:hypothetical protein